MMKQFNGSADIRRVIEAGKNNTSLFVSPSHFTRVCTTLKCGTIIEEEEINAVNVRAEHIARPGEGMAS